jgi:hypothetical protein
MNIDVAHGLLLIGTHMYLQGAVVEHKILTLHENIYSCIIQFDPVWCNGNTTDFDSVVLGSSPGTGAKQWRHSG